MPASSLQRYFYADDIATFIQKDPDSILGVLAANNTFELETSQRDAWIEEISILKSVLASFRQPGHVYLEYSIPRLGKRVDAIVLLGPVIFAIEFKVCEKTYPSHAIDQVWDYALDLKNFHEASHSRWVAPILVATNAPDLTTKITQSSQNDRVLEPLRCNSQTLLPAIRRVVAECDGGSIDPLGWQAGRYSPTPTIVEAAQALYKGHSVDEISRSDAGATNLTVTSGAIEETIRWAKEQRRKVICFVTGVPGAGKTLVGLNVATKHFDKEEDLYSVFLSGNGPLVAILREALARDKVSHERERGRKTKLGDARREVQMFIQNVHHFRDECLVDTDRPPIEHVAIFDEAQRAWDVHQTSKFMRGKKKIDGFNHSEPEFLISCLNRHEDWAVVVCLVGGGQEINTGEAGISEWIKSVQRSFPDWNLLISSQLRDSEYAAGDAIEMVQSLPHVTFRDELHLAVSMRSYRAENVSSLVKHLLDFDVEQAQSLCYDLVDRYPIVITRDLTKAKNWLRKKARGTERYGLVASSQAQRLKPYAIDVRVKTDPIHWFLDGKEDVRSSFYLEDVATEFQVQGLELDWTCVTWDADLRRDGLDWRHWSFHGARWKHIHKEERKIYLKNAYRVLLTRARQGMVIFVPDGDSDDPTRLAEFYDPTFEYLREIGFSEL